MTPTELLLFLTGLSIVYVGYALLFSYWYAYWFDLDVLDRLPVLDLQIPFAERIFRDPPSPTSGQTPWTRRLIFGALMILGSFGMLGFTGGYISIFIRIVSSLVSGQGFGLEIN